MSETERYRYHTNMLANYKTNPKQTILFWKQNCTAQSLLLHLRALMSIKRRKLSFYIEDKALPLPLIKIPTPHKLILISEVRLSLQ